MDFAFTDEQEDLRQAVRRFAADRCAEGEIGCLGDDKLGFDREAWAAMADQLELQGLLVPEEHGGAGLGHLELAVVLEELGRALCCSAYFATVALATTALLESGDEQACTDLLPGIASGETVATLAIAGDDGQWTDAGAAIRAVERRGRWRLEGSSDLVVDLEASSLVLVAARADTGPTLFAVDPRASGVARRPMPGFDRTRRLARLELRDTPARVVGAVGGASSMLERVFDLASVALAAEQVGGAQRCLEMAVDYARAREQFGRPVGSFQAIKHACADVLVDVESAKSAAYYAAWCARERNDELPGMACMAMACCSDAYLRAARTNIHVHGALGFTAEHPAHLYYKRAKASELLLGGATLHRDRLVARLVAG